MTRDKMKACALSALKLSALMGGSLVIAIVAGYVLLVAAYSVPVEKMRENARKAVRLFKDEGDYPAWSGNLMVMETWQYTRLDRFTDMWMCRIAATLPSGPAYKTSLLNDSLCGDGAMSQRYESDFDTAKLKDLQYDSYGRYWHGYLIYLKPFLYFWTPQEIRIITAVLSLICFMVACCSVRKHLGIAALIAFFAASLIVNPISASLCLQYMSCFMIATLAVAFVANRYQRLDFRRLALFFFIVGMLTSYFDLLSYPLVTWGLPFVMYVVAVKPDNPCKALCAGVASAFWFPGYALMWASKWILGTLVTGTNIIKDAIGAGAVRTSGEVAWAGEFTARSVIERNWNMFAHTPVVPLIVVACIAIVAIVAVKREKVRISRWPSIVLLLSAVAAPLVWMSFMQNHSLVHAFMASKIFSIVAFAVLALPLVLCGAACDDGGKELEQAA